MILRSRTRKRIWALDNRLTNQTKVPFVPVIGYYSILRLSPRAVPSHCGFSRRQARRVFLKSSENYPKSSRKLFFVFTAQSSRKVRASKQSRHFTPESYGSSHTRENVFGKLVADKMAAAGALFFKVYSVKK